VKPGPEECCSTEHCWSGGATASDRWQGETDSTAGDPNNSKCCIHMYLAAILKNTGVILV